MSTLGEKEAKIMRNKTVKNETFTKWRNTFYNTEIKLLC